MPNLDEQQTAPEVATEKYEASEEVSDKNGNKASSVYRAFDLWGFSRSEWLQGLALLITGAFVVLEVQYNIGLLDTLIDPSATRENIQSLSDRGKLLAAVGISWASGRFLFERIRPALIGLALLFVLAFAIHSGLDYVYTSAIRDLPASVKLKGFSLFSYRQDLLTGKLSDPDIPLPKDDAVTGRIIMGAFPIVLADDRFMLPARDIIERKANDKIRFVLKDAEVAWPDYAQQMQELRDGHRDFISGSQKALQYGSDGINEFRKKSNGLTPNATLTLVQFVDMLRQNKDHPKGKVLRDGEARQIAKRPDGSAVLAGEVPKFMEHKNYLAWFSAQAKDARDKAIPTETSIERLDGIQDINSAVFLPPMAMIASLTSAVTNGLTFILLAASLIACNVGSSESRRRGRFLRKFSAPIMGTLFILLLVSAPAYVFQPGPLQNLEAKMHHSVGLAGHVWSRLSNIQKYLLQATK